MPAANALPVEVRRDELEHRFLALRAEAQAFLARVAEHLALDVYDAAKPIAYSRTTYLDAHDRRYFRSCAEPVARRARIREYAAASALDEPPTLTGVCFLELKESAGSARSKQRVALPADALARLLRGEPLPPTLVDRLQRHAALAAIAEDLRTGVLMPRMTTWYRRISMSAGDVRVTLDEGVALCAPAEIGDTTAPAEPRSVARYLPGRILEVKVRGPVPSWLEAAMLPLVPTEDFSKFRSGMLAVQRRSQVAKSRTQPLAVVAPIRVRSAQSDA